MTDNDRDEVADAPEEGPQDVVDAVVGVIDIKFRGGGWMERGRDNGKERGFVDPFKGLKPL